MDGSTDNKATKGERTRAAILDHATAIASRLGLEGLTIGSLADATGMSKSGLFAHFGSREELQLAVLEDAAQRFADVVAQPSFKIPRGLPRLRAIVEHWCEWAQRYERGCVLLSAVGEYDGRDGALHDAVVRQQAGWRSQLEKAIGQAVDEAHLGRATDVTQLAFEIYAFMLVLHHDAGLFGYEEARRRALAAVDRLFASYRT